MNRTTLVAGGAALAAAAGLAVAAPAAAAPPSNGCPSNWDRVYILDLDPAYKVPALVDSPTNSYSFGNKPGNDNKYVCALALGNQSVDGHQIYNFMDDSLQTEG